MYSEQEQGNEQFDTGYEDWDEPSEIAPQEIAQQEQPPEPTFTQEQYQSMQSEIQSLQSQAQEFSKLKNALAQAAGQEVKPQQTPGERQAQEVLDSYGYMRKDSVQEMINNALAEQQRQVYEKAAVNAGYQHFNHLEAEFYAKMYGAATPQEKATYEKIEQEFGRNPEAAIAQYKALKDQAAPVANQTFGHNSQSRGSTSKHRFRSEAEFNAFMAKDPAKASALLDEAMRSTAGYNTLYPQ